MRILIAMGDGRRMKAKDRIIYVKDPEVFAVFDKYGIFKLLQVKKTVSLDFFIKVLHTLVYSVTYNEDAVSSRILRDFSIDLLDLKYASDAIFITLEEV